MDASPLCVFAATPPAAAQPPAAHSPHQAEAPGAGYASLAVLEDKENVLPAGTPLGGPQLPPFAGGKKGEAAARRPLSDVTQHYAAGTKGSICIGYLGGCFSMAPEAVPAAAAVAPQAIGCSQQAAMEAHAAAAQARAAAKRRALRAMR